MENEKNINLNEDAANNFKFEKFEYSPEAIKLKEKIKLLYKKDVSLTMDKIATFARELQTRYDLKELHNYEAYCALAGSTPLEKPKKFDLDGDDSIEKFINSLEEELT